MYIVPIPITYCLKRQVDFDQNKLRGRFKIKNISGPFYIGKQQLKL